MIAEPVLAAQAGTDVVGIETGGHPLVVHQQALLQAVQRRIAGERGDVLAGNLCQRPGQQDAALQLVDLVVRAALQHHAVLHAAGGQVADLQGHDVRTREQIGMPQVVQAAAGADELVVARRGLSLRAEHAQLGTRIAPAVGDQRTPVQCRAVQRTLVLRVLGPRDARAVVAPQRLVLVPVHPQVEPAHRVHVAVGGGVVAVDGVVQIRIQAAEHILGIGLGEAVEQPVQVPFGRIGLCRDQVLAAQLGLAVERQPAIADHIVLIARVVGEGRAGTTGLVLRDGDVGQAHAEEVAPGDVHIQRMGRCRAASGLTASQTDLELVVAHRHQILGHELAFLVQRIVLAVDRQRGRGGDVAALDADTRSVHRDVLLAQPVAGEHALHQALRLGLLGAERGALCAFDIGAQLVDAALCVFGRHQLQRARMGLIERTVPAVGAQHVDQFIALAEPIPVRQRAIP